MKEINDSQVMQLLTNTAVHDVKMELDRARAKHPENKHMLAALMEEVGELAKALLEGDDEYYTEAIQVACVAIRIATEGDPSFPVTHRED